MPSPPSIGPRPFGSPKQKTLAELYKQLAEARKKLEAELSAAKKRGGSRKRRRGGRRTVKRR